MFARYAFRAFILLGPLQLTACGDNPNVRAVGTDEYQDYQQEQGGDRGKLLGDQGLVFGIGKGANATQQSDGAALGVNAYLWRGALDTLAFMPLASADPFGGVIITDWYQPPATPDERFKATAYILGRQLRAMAFACRSPAGLAERPVGRRGGEPDHDRRDREQGVGAGTRVACAKPPAGDGGDGGRAVVS